jgi:glycosyltransferase involved in cell wall biosynthesis
MRWIIVHHHFRPGGVRRVIEQATPHLVEGRARSVVLVGGEAPEPLWYEKLVERLAPMPVTWEADPAFGYVAEAGMNATEIARRVGKTLRRVLDAGEPGEDWIWIHNAGLGRNVVMVRELARVCRKRNIRVAWHHHDWWFENRWSRWAEMRRLQVTTLREAARAAFPAGTGWLHAGINRRDVDRLRRGFPGQSVWLPNPVEFGTRGSVRSGVDGAGARRWLAERLDGDGSNPVWIVPCRFLRRKNMAEAALITRWLRPEAWLVTTAGASSEEERPTWERFSAAARDGQWRVRISILDRAGAGAPSVESLLETSEAVVLSSIQEGFGLPYLEAAAAGRPLIGRRLANVVPDLESLGLTFPTLYEEILVSPSWLDWNQELARQERLFAAWKSGLPRSCRTLVQLPEWLCAEPDRGVPFSRLTFTGQLEVLHTATPASVQEALRLNPWLARWRTWATAGKLPRITWESDTAEKLSGRTYARRFWKAARAAAGVVRAGAESAERVQAGFLRERLGADHLYPLLWHRNT